MTPTPENKIYLFITTKKRIKITVNMKIAKPSFQSCKIYFTAFKQTKNVSTESLSAGADPDWVSWAGVYEGDMILTDEQARDLYDVSIYI